MFEESILKVFIFDSYLEIFNFAVLLKIRKCHGNHQRKLF